MRDDLIVLTGTKVAKKYPQPLRRVVAWVEVDGQERLMEFLTDNLAWAASTVAELYKSRWAIEAFFKQLKQTLRFLAWLHDWSHSFNRIVAIARAALWSLLDLAKLLAAYGTAGGDIRLIQGPEQLYLPGIGPLGT